MFSYEILTLMPPFAFMVRFDNNLHENLSVYFYSNVL